MKFCEIIKQFTPLSKKAQTILEGKHIYLRDICLSDVTDNYARWMNDAEVVRLTESRSCNYSKADLKEYVKSKLEDENTVFFVIILKENNQHIGNIKLGSIDWVQRTGDIGLIIGEKDCWGKGYATEMIGLVCEYAFNSLGLEKLTTGYYEGNEASCKVFKKNGFVNDFVSDKTLDNGDVVKVFWLIKRKEGL